MDREGAETHLRLLAEAELRHATTRPADGGLLDECHSARLELVAQVVWLRDGSGRWHTARPARSGPLRDSDDFLLWLRVAPLPDHGTPWIDMVAAGSSAEIRARLPLSWKS